MRYHVAIELPACLCLLDLGHTKQVCLPLLNAHEQFIRGFAVEVLGDELSSDGEVEDSLAQLFDLFGVGGEARKVAEVEMGVLAERLGIRAVV